VVSIDASKGSFHDMPIDFIIDLSNVRFLDLSFNPSLIIPPIRPFLISSSLETLNLSYCDLEYLPDRMFIFLFYLQILDLSYNRLNRLDESVTGLPISLRVLYVHGNPIEEEVELSYLNSVFIDILHRDTYTKQHLDILYKKNNTIRPTIKYYLLLILILFVTC
jgi:Leucine-rich repeat (LRR) protein